MNGLPLRYFGAVSAKLLIEMVTVRARNVCVCVCMGKDRSANSLKAVEIIQKVANVLMGRTWVVFKIEIKKKLNIAELKFITLKLCIRLKQSVLFKIVIVFHT